MKPAWPEGRLGEDTVNLPASNLRAYLDGLLLSERLRGLAGAERTRLPPVVMRDIEPPALGRVAFALPDPHPH
jgi:hypothetical protein